MPSRNAVADGSIQARVLEAFRRIDEVDRPEVWIHLSNRDQAVARAAAIERSVADGAELPLAGLLIAVKDNIDVAGMPTTAGCPEFGYQPSRSATAVQRLEDAGALIIGKTNLDQFATGLVGSRSPYGAVRHAGDPTKVSGGSSSGSATAVALGLVDAALGTDTAGSGRVPASFNGLVGIKPTLGLVPNSGVVPASRSYDAVTVFAKTLPAAAEILRTMTGPDATDPLSRDWPENLRLAAPPAPVVAVPTDSALEVLSDEGRAAFAAATARVESMGAQLRPVDVTVLLDAAKLLYDGALVAERYAAVGEFLDTEPEGADPTVSTIIRGARTIPAHQLVADLEKLDHAKSAARGLLAGVDALLLPTTTEHPSLDAVSADPLGVNRRLGTFTNFVNLLDLAAVAVPSGFADGSPFGVTFISHDFADQVGLDLAARFLGEPAPEYATGGVSLAVFGAHLRGQPLNRQLTDAGARFLGDIRTAENYLLYALDTEVPKPGLVAVGHGCGQTISGELWSISRAGLGAFLADLPFPMNLGKIRLDDGREVVGFGCAADAIDGAEDISRFGGWNAYLENARQR